MTPAAAPVIYGVILAGGRSSRFGREKAMAELDGRPMIAWVADAIGSGVAALAVSARADSGAAAFARDQGWPVLEDDGDDPQGPLAGVLTGLRWVKAAGAAWLCTAPCDTPFLPADLVDRLWRNAGSGGALAQTPDRLQPLAALWPVRALETLERWPGRAAPRDLLEYLGAAPVDFPDAHAFANLNTPQDYAAARGAAARCVR